MRPDIKTASPQADLAEVERAQAEARLRQSASRYRTLFNSIDEGFCVIEMLFDDAAKPVDYRFEETNPAFARMTGLEQAAGKTARQLVPNLEQWWFETYGKVATTGEAARFEHHAQAMNRWFSVHASRVGDETSRKVALVFTNITERKRAEEQLRASEERFRAIVNQASVGVAQTDLTGRFTLVNQRYCDITGFTEADLLARRIQDITHPEDWPRNLELLERMLAEGRPFEIEKRYIRKDGSHVWVHNGVAFLHGSDGKPQALVAMSFDVTERRRAEAALREAGRRKDEFLATLGHELRNPLAPLKNALEILRVNDGDRGNVSRMREKMAYQVNHLARLVDDLLEVSRITRGRIELRKEKVELKEVIENAIETSQPLIEAAGHDLSVTLPQRPLHTDGDRVRLTQVVANLLNNAVKYTDGKGRIDLSVAREGDNAVVRVRDNGIGISPMSLPGIFELFVQAEESATRAQGGLGIGLTLVKQIVELHGGSVEARSAGVGCGSEFVIRLPVNSDEQQQPSDAPPAAPDDRAARRVLVADDNAAAADTLGELLELYGNDARVVHDGQAALDAFDVWRPDVMLLDIGMPGMDGYEVARRVRRHPGSDGVTLIALTGLGQDKDRERAHAAGFDHHLLKPLDLAALRALLDAPPP